MFNRSLGANLQVRHLLDNGSLYFPPFDAGSFRQDIHWANYKCVSSNTVGTIFSRDLSVKAGKLRFNHYAQAPMQLLHKIPRVFTMAWPFPIFLRIQFTHCLLIPTVGATTRQSSINIMIQKYKIRALSLAVTYSSNAIYRHLSRTMLRWHRGCKNHHSTFIHRWREVSTTQLCTFIFVLIHIQTHRLCLFVHSFVPVV